MAKTTVTNTDGSYRNRPDAIAIADILANAYNGYIINLDSLQTATGGSADGYIPDYDSVSGITELITFAINNLYNVVLYITVKTSFDKCKNKLINAGSYIGQVKDILHVLEQVYTGDNTLDDQKILVKYCKTNPNDFYIDLKNELFLTIDRPFDSIHPYLTVKNNKIYYNNNRPFFIHGNGHTYLDSTLDLVGYKNVNINHKLYYKNKSKYFISTYFNEVCYVSIYILIFIALFIYIFIKKYNK
jgi:hypothetical protein